MDPEDAMILSGEWSDMGWDDMGDDDIGARRRRGGLRRGGGRRGAGPAAARRQRLMAIQPDASGQALDQIMPFPNGTFTAAINALNLVAQPQRDFQLRRLVIDFARIGASAVGPIVQVTALTVGADPQFVQTGSIPAVMFAFNAVGVHLKPNAARPGVTVTLALSVTAGLAGADTIVVSAAGQGPALG